MQLSLWKYLQLKRKSKININGRTHTHTHTHIYISSSRTDDSIESQDFFLAICPFRPYHILLLTSLLGRIQCPYKPDLYEFLLVGQHWYVQVEESRRELSTHGKKIYSHHS